LEIDEIRKLKKEIECLKEEIERLRSAIGGKKGVEVEKKIIIDIPSVSKVVDPVNVVVEDLISSIRENVRRALEERREEAVEELVENLPAERASLILQSLANTDRIRILKLLYKGPATFSEVKEVLGVESPSVSHHLKMLQRSGLVVQLGTRGGYTITPRGRLLLRVLSLISQALAGEEAWGG